MMWHVLELYSFLWLNNILLYKYVIFCLSLHPSWDTILATCTFKLLLEFGFSHDRDPENTLLITFQLKIIF